MKFLSGGAAALVVAVGMGFGLGMGLVATPPAAAKVFDPQTFTLPNGLQVVVVTNMRAPVITHMVWYRVGAADEPRGKSGIAHYLEHLMFKGTDKIKVGEFSRIIARNGGRDNAFTSNDYTGYYQNVASDRLALVMEMESDRMANLRLTDEVARAELDVVLEERRMRTDNEPSSKLYEQVQAAMFLNHPYRIPVIGWEPEIRGLTFQDGLDFYRTWYAPNNAVLVVAGAVTVNEVRPLAEKFYGPIPSRPVPARVRALEPEHVASARVEMSSERVRQPTWSRRYLAPSYRVGYGDAKASHAYALEVLSEILGGGATSRLNRHLVLEQQIAASASAGYDPDRFDLGSFVISASPRDAAGLEGLEKAVATEVRTLLADGVSEAEVTRAKARLQAGTVYALDSATTAARTLGAGLVTGRTIEEIESWPERISAVTPEQVMEAARAVLHDETAVTSVLHPKPAS